MQSRRAAPSQTRRMLHSSTGSTSIPIAYCPTAVALRNATRCNVADMHHRSHDKHDVTSLTHHAPPSSSSSISKASMSSSISMAGSSSSADANDCAAGLRIGLLFGSSASSHCSNVDGFAADRAAVAFLLAAASPEA